MSTLTFLLILASLCGLRVVVIIFGWLASILTVVVLLALLQLLINWWLNSSGPRF